MNRLLLILILTLSFQSWSKADDISIMEIEGVSVGDSLLDYFNSKQIKDKRKFLNIGGKILEDFSRVILKKNLENYETVSLSFKSNDSKYIILGIAGRNYYEQNISQCYKDMEKISKEIETSFKELKRNDYSKRKIKNLPSGNSYVTKIGYFIEGGVIGLQCYDFSPKDVNDRDRLSIIIFSDEYNNALMQ